jgi:hypothetical protein
MTPARALDGNWIAPLHVGDTVSHTAGRQDQYTGQQNGCRRSAFAQGIPGFHIVVGSTLGPSVGFG